jgi:chaperonin GroES
MYLRKQGDTMIERPSVEDIRPTGDMVLVEKLEVSTASVGGILMPVNDSESEEYGYVHAVGPGFHQNGILIKPSVQAGDTVMLRKGRGLPVRVDADTLFFMNERDFLAVVKLKIRS